jgi:GT2 family glycosyltransferase
MSAPVFFSIVLPTFGRPEEVIECLESLCHQTRKDFEVIIADGSPADDVRPGLAPFLQKLSMQVVYEKYLPVSNARNRGAEKANGEWLLFLDSDCLIPPDYLRLVGDTIERENPDLYGGPDAAHASFTDVQKAISYSMTSLFTTGGIRGKKTHVGKFHPRGFNMGIKRSAFFSVNGYAEDFRCGEDIELSIRLIKAGFKSMLIPEAYVYHKRRTDFSKFFRQVKRFGAARINLFRRHSEELKVTHFFPAFFLLYHVFWLLSPLICCPLALGMSLLLAVYAAGIFLDSAQQNKSISVGLLSVAASWVQLIGYGSGFLQNAWVVFVLRNPKGMKL